MIFITGASGLIGSFVCRELLLQGYSIKALKRTTTDLHLVQDIKDKIEWVEGDLLNVSEVGSYLERVKQVIHCAAFVSYDSKDEELMQQVNVEGTANLVNASLQHQIELFLHISSVAAIGKDKTSDTSTEATQWTDDKPSAYARTKYQAELEVWRGWAEGLKTLIINPSLVLGPGDWDKSSTQLFKYIWQENRFYTNGLVNYVDVRDVAEITVGLLESEVAGERFIVSGGSISYKSLFELIAREMNKKSPSIRVNSSMIRLAVLFERLRSKISGTSPMITDELKQVSRNHHQYANDKIKNKLDFEFRSLEETIKWSCQQLSKDAAV